MNDLTTTSGSDYVAPTIVPMTIVEGTMSTTIEITINEDLLDEIDETLEVNLSTPTNATICDAQGIGTIVDNDATPCVSIDDVTVDEADGTATFTVTLDAVSGQDVSVDYQINDVEAVVPDDCCLLYTSPSPRDRQKSRMPSSA